MTRYLPSVLASLLLAGCAAAVEHPSTPTAMMPVATAGDIPKARLALKRTLKDPDSVKFEGEVLRPGAVCGLFNAKNSFGGYVGSTLYGYSVQTGQVIVLQEGTPYSTEKVVEFEAYQRMCSR